MEEMEEEAVVATKGRWRSKGTGGAREGEGEGLVALVTLSTLSLYITSTPS